MFHPIQKPTDMNYFSKDKTNFFFKPGIVIVLGMLAISGCKKDDDIVENPPPPANEGEVITTMRLIATDSATNMVTDTFTFRDPDGDGGSGPDIFDTIRLAPNKTYLMQLVLLNETVTPADSISNEVLAEANDHMFFFHYTGAAITQTYLDQDTNTPPLGIGLQTKWKTGAASSGTSQVILKHQPGVKDGTETPGETDMDITFQTVIQ